MAERKKDKEEKQSLIPIGKWVEFMENNKENRVKPLYPIDDYDICSSKQELELWNYFKNSAKKTFGDAEFINWFHKLGFYKLYKGNLYIFAPTNFFKGYIESTYSFFFQTFAEKNKLESINILNWNTQKNYLVEENQELAEINSKYNICYKYISEADTFEKLEMLVNKCGAEIQFLNEKQASDKIQELRKFYSERINLLKELSQD